MHLNLVGVEPDFVSYFEFLRRLAVFGHLFLASSKRCFGVHLYFLELVKMLVNYGDVAVTTGGDSEVGLVAVHDLKRGVLQDRLNAAIDCKFSYWEESSPIVLPLLGEEPEILLDLLVHSFYLSVCLKVVRSC